MAKSKRRVKNNFVFTEHDDSVWTSDLYYDVFQGNLSELIERTDRKDDVKAAIALLTDWLDQAETEGHLELG